MQMQMQIIFVNHCVHNSVSIIFRVIWRSFPHFIVFIIWCQELVISDPAANIPWDLVILKPQEIECPILNSPSTSFRLEFSSDSCLCIFPHRLNIVWATDFLFQHWPSRRQSTCITAFDVLKWLFLITWYVFVMKHDVAIFIYWTYCWLPIQNT